MIFKIIFLGLSSFLTILMLILLIVGKKYEVLIDGLKSRDYPLKSFYIVGYALEKVIRLQGDFRARFVRTLSVIEDNPYSDYYAHLKWAQFLSFSFIAVTWGAAVASFLSGPATVFIFAMFLIVVAGVYYWFIARFSEMVDTRRKACEAEFPNMVAKLALLMNSGMVLREAWKLIAYGGNGELYKLMCKSCEDMDNGASDKEAISKFSIRVDSQDIKKFTSSMLQALDKGNSEIADFFLKQNEELWKHKRQLALQEGEIIAGKLVIPLGITFGGIILIIIVAVFQSFSL